MIVQAKFEIMPDRASKFIGEVRNGLESQTP